MTPALPPAAACFFHCLLSLGRRKGLTESGLWRTGQEEGRKEGRTFDRQDWTGLGHLPVCLPACACGVCVYSCIVPDMFQIPLSPSPYPCPSLSLLALATLPFILFRTCVSHLHLHFCMVKTDNIGMLACINRRKKADLGTLLHCHARPPLLPGVRQDREDMRHLLQDIDAGLNMNSHGVQKRRVLDILWVCSPILLLQTGRHESFGCCGWDDCGIWNWTVPWDCTFLSQFGVLLPSLYHCLCSLQLCFSKASAFSTFQNVPPLPFHCKTPNLLLNTILLPLPCPTPPISSAFLFSAFSLLSHYCTLHFPVLSCSTPHWLPAAQHVWQQALPISSHDSLFCFTTTPTTANMPAFLSMPAT